MTTRHDPFHSSGGSIGNPINDDDHRHRDMSSSEHDNALSNSVNSIPGTPYTPSFSRRRPALEHRSLSKLSVTNSQSSRDHDSQSQWSIFGQVMENEVNLHASWTSQGFNGSSTNLANDAALGGPSHHHEINAGDDDAETTSLLTDHHHDVSAADDQSFTSSQTTATQRQSPSHNLFHSITLSPVAQNVLKCAFAYFIASLFTFSPTLSALISDLTSYGPGGNRGKPSPSGHMVATIAVYFHPAKTVGSMIEADIFCIFGIFYAAIICLVSMSMFWWFELKPGWETTGDVVVIFWIGVSMAILAWLKVWMDNPSFNTTCSMTAIMIFVVIIKEGGMETLLQVSVIYLFGALVSNLVCYLLWPQTARSNLQTSMTKTLGGLSTLLPMLTTTFLLEGDGTSHFVNMDKIKTAVANHQNSFTNLRKYLKEAKNEWILTGTSASADLLGRRAYEDAVDSLNRLAQHLNGLRSGTSLQHDLIKAGLTQKTSRIHGGNRPSQQAVDEDSDEAAGLRAAATVFNQLVHDLAPPLKALSNCSTSTLQRLQEACTRSTKDAKRASDIIHPNEFTELIEGIETSMTQFELISNNAVMRLYRQGEQDGHDPGNEAILLVFFFIFTFQEFAGELITLVELIERIYQYEQHRTLKGAWWSRFTQRFLRLFTLRFKKAGSQNRPRSNLRNRLSFVILPQRRANPSFPKIRPHAPNTIQTPSKSQLSFVGKVNQTLWEIGKRMTEKDIKYAIKVGLATAIFATPAFIESTRLVFLEFWGDWALISFFIVISPTIGATNFLSLQRLLGTFFGAAVAVAFYSLFPENAVILSLLGFMVSLPCFYVAIAKPKYLSASRFVLLTYNLTCLFCYNLRQQDLAVVDIGIQRAVAVIAGILWAAFVSRFWWPSEARRELSESLSEFCLNIGWLYTRLVASNSFAPEYQRGQGHNRHGTDVSQVQTTKLANSIHEFMAMELHLQIKLIELQNLLVQAQHEPRLKGPFPVDLYRKILISLQTILDKLHSMRCVTTKEEWYTSVRKEFILPVSKERREMVGNIMLSFSTLAAAFRLKAPLPPYLPPAEKSRQRLVEAIRKLEVVKRRDVKVSRQLLYFAYALTMKGVTMELEFLGRTLQDAFGVIGQTAEEFEMLFQPMVESESTIEHVS
ncbi:Fusaric acid resistance protein-like-domain-containing protein [Panaeolus papilionaceus]|nr:Fusaric acid resistance protein-like-domain-containing protein [Panaeolus papilionaceus]